MLHLSEVIKEPLLTERNTLLKEISNVYVFKVGMKANKNQIKDALQKYYGVKVKGVRTQIVRGKTKRTGRFVSKKQNCKKAFVTLNEGESLNMIEGL